jgi:hypothetical protein
MSSLSDTASADLHRQAADPSTDLGTLADIATHHPALRATVAANPSTYEGLLDWLGQLGDPAVDAALAIRAGGAPVAAPAVSPYAAAAAPAVSPYPAAAVSPTGTWTEPTRSLPLAWGTYNLRYGVALGLAVLPVVNNLIFTVLYATTYFDGMYELGSVLGIFGRVLFWGAAIAVIPSTLKGRLIAAGLVLATFLPSLVYPVLGGGILYLFVSTAGEAAMIGAWLAVRLRPGRAYALLPIVIPGIVIGYLLGGGSLNIVLTLLSTVIAIGIIWLGRAIAAAGSATPATPADREAAAHDARVEHIRQWESAYAAAHGGALPPAGFVPPAAAASGATNTMAILALVFGIGGGLGGIIFGHVARGQIRRTGEGGWGLATAGLVLGYIGLASGVIALIVWLILWATLLN